MRYLISAFLGLTFCFSATWAEPTKTLPFTVKGFSGPNYFNGEVSLHSEHYEPTGAPAGSDKPQWKLTHTLIAKAAVKEGHFLIEGKIDKPMRVTIEFKCTDDQGRRFGSIKGLGFILEPANFTAKFREDRKLIVHGGKLQDLLINSWLESDVYLAAQRKMSDIYKDVNKKGYARGSREYSKAMEPYNAELHKAIAIESNALGHIATSHPDPNVRLLALQSTLYRSEWSTKAIVSIAQMDPNNLWANSIVQSLNKEQKKVRPPLTNARHFSARNLNGKTTELNDVLKQNKYVLIDFWASWCGGCRAEFPHLKRVYERYNSQGLEIVSFTLDNSLEDWQEASEEDDLPWLNLGFGEEHPVIKQYEVFGVPANFLIDSTTGRIIAKSLRGHKLDEKMEELITSMN